MENRRLLPAFSTVMFSSCMCSEAHSTALHHDRAALSSGSMLFSAGSGSKSSSSGLCKLSIASISSARVAPSFSLRYTVVRLRPVAFATSSMVILLLT